MWADPAEGDQATTGLLGDGRSRGWILGLWGAIVAVSGLFAWLGFTLLGSASDATVAFVLAFAGGAVLTMLADTMMPEAFAHGGRSVGLVTTLGFAVAVATTAVEQTV